MALPRMVDPGEGQPPPHDEEAEIALLYSLGADGTERAQTDVRVDDFYLGSHRAVFRAMLELDAEGERISGHTIRTKLKETGHHTMVSAEVLDRVDYCHGAGVCVSRYAKIVRELAKRRRVIDAARRAMLRCYLPNDTSDDVMGELRETFDALGVTSADSRLYRLEPAAELAEPLPPISWICEGLRIARGAVILVGGYGFSRKTMFAQALALAVASGTRALGVYSTVRANVLHVDYEQGTRITRERYQRLARAAGLNLQQCGISVATFPRFRLTDASARETIRRMLAESKAGLVIVDSLRAATPRVDENSSEIREYIDVLGEEAKRADVAVVLIHHARKPAMGEKSGGKFSLRGSAAIFDAADSIYIFGGEKGQPTVVEHEKDRLMGTTLDTFGLDSEDVADAIDPRWGLRLVHLEGEQMEERREEERASASASADERAQAAIKKHLASVGGSFRGSRGDLRDALGMKRDLVVKALGFLVSSGEVAIEGSQRDQTIRLRGQS